MVVLKIASILLLLSYPLGEITRFSLDNSVAITLTDILVASLGLIWTILLLFKKTKLKQPINIITVVIFITTAFLSLLVNIPNFSRHELFVSSLYFVRWTFYSLVLFIFSGFDQAFKQPIKKLLLVSGGLIIVIGYAQYFLYQNLRNLFYLGWDDHLYRLFSSFFDPNFVGSFYVLYFLFILGFLIKFTKNKNKRWLAFLLTIEVLTFISIILTYSRSAIISFIFGTSIFLILARKKKLILAIVAVILFIFVLLSPLFYIENINIFRTASSLARVESVKNAFIIFRDHPLFGVGFNTYRYAQIKYGFRHGTSALISHADAGTDNSFLFVLATTGIVGFVAYINVWIKIIQKFLSSIKNPQNINSLVVLSSIAAIFVDSIFVNSLIFPPLMLWMWILIGVMD